MKKFGLVAMSLSLCALSYASEVYVCKTKSGSATVVVSRGSHIDDPERHTFEYLDGLRDNRENEPTVDRTVLGKVVSMSFRVWPDHSTTYASLVIPAMNLENSDAQEFTTIFTITEKMTHFGGPQFVKGLLDRSTHEVVSCTGSIAH